LSCALSLSILRSLCSRGLSLPCREHCLLAFSGAVRPLRPPSSGLSTISDAQTQQHRYGEGILFIDVVQHSISRTGIAFAQFSRTYHAHPDSQLSRANLSAAAAILRLCEVGCFGHGVGGSTELSVRATLVAGGQLLIHVCLHSCPGHGRIARGLGAASHLANDADTATPGESQNLELRRDHT
jgi:hypothetical protein